MRRPRLSKEELESIQRLLEKDLFLTNRRRRLYNKTYRKSFFFIAVWAGRIIYCILFFAVVSFHTTTVDSRAEIVIHKRVENDVVNTKSSYPQKTIFIETNFSKYTSTMDKHYRPEFNEGDTLLIERNVFGKSAFISKANWTEKYMIDYNVLFYFAVLILTFLSLFFNDGLDPFTDKLLLAMWALDIITALCYFLY